MTLVFNSDLLFANSLIVNDLPKKLKEFLLQCINHETQHEIIIPLTTLLEFNRKKNEFVEKERKNLKNAKELFSKYDINSDEFDPTIIIKVPDLIEMIQEVGIECKVEKPIKEDYDNAHTKACLKHEPCPPNQKSDEMRDLIIWEISKRIAGENNGAILLSRDEVHTHHRGDEDAVNVDLIRCDSFERAYEALSIETVSAKKIKSLLDNFRYELTESELPVHEGYQIISIKKPKFINTESSTTKVLCEILLNSGDGKKINARMNIEFLNEKPFHVHFSEVVIDGNNSNEDIIIESIREDIFDTKYHTQHKKLKRMIKD